MCSGKHNDIYLYMKITFLLALASVKRFSKLHASPVESDTQSVRGLVPSFSFQTS